MEKQLEEINLRLKQLVALHMIDYIDSGGLTAGDKMPTDMMDFDSFFKRQRMKERTFVEHYRKELESATEALSRICTK